MNLHNNARTCPYSRALIVERVVMRGEPARDAAEVFETVLALDGTWSGEHGIGYEKRDFVGLEIEPAPPSISP